MLSYIDRVAQIHISVWRGYCKVERGGNFLFMNKCLRCGKACEQDLFCDDCQSVLLRRSLQREETHEVLSQASLATRVSSIAAPSSRNSVHDPAVQAPSFVPGQDVVSGGEQDSSHNTFDKAYNGARQSSTLTMSQVLRPQHIRSSRLRSTFTIMVIIAIIALISNSILIFLVIYRHQHYNNSVQNVPIITFASGTVYPGQIALLHLSHFPAQSRVLLRRDIEHQVLLNTGSSVVQLDSRGEADVHMLVEDNWGTGSHLIEAEDIDSHYVASTAIQVMSGGPAQLPHLQLNQSELDLGADQQGANTLQPLKLENTASGTISWTAWSNQPWLMLTPMMGIFSVSQQVVIAVNRSHLKSGIHEGIVTFVGNNGLNVPVHVKMSVLPLQTDLGAALVVSPPVLSFIAADGGSDPAMQLLTVSNPGSRPLYWSLSGSAPTVSTDGEMPFMDTMNWLGVKPTSGMVAPGSTTSIRFNVSSHMLLPGAYSGILTFTGGQNTLNSSQLVAVSLSVQPRCGIMASTGNISFSMINGHKGPNGQSLALSLSPGCSGSVAWQASSMAEWLAITPSSGRVKEQADSLTTVTVDSSGLPPGTYTSFLVFVTEHRTQTVAVQLTVLALSGKSAKSTTGSSSAASGTSNNTNGAGATSAGEPALDISPTSMTFSVMQGEHNPPDQAVTVANTGGGLLYWQARADTTISSWLSVAPAIGSVASGKNGYIFLRVNTSSLSPGIYRSNVVVSATEESGTQVLGSPQVVSVVLNVEQPCALQVTSTSLSFSASLLAPNPAGQYITLQTVGNCVYPVTWTATVDTDSRSWLIPSVTSGQDSGQGSVITVRVNTSGMLLGFYRGQISVSAVDSSGASASNTAPTVGVALTVIG